MLAKNLIILSVTKMNVVGFGVDESILNRKKERACQ